MAKKKSDLEIANANQEEAIELRIEEDAYAHFTHPKKRAMLNMLVRTLGVVTTACNAVGINRRSHYDWMEVDAEYRKAVEELNNIVLDFAESHLHKKIKDGDTIATIFFLKTKGKKRGYIERQEVTGADGKELRSFDWSELFGKRNDAQA